MSEPASHEEDPRLEQIIELLTRLASGDLDARLPVAGGADQLDVIISGLNMFAEELSSSIEEERKLRETLQIQVEKRTAELVEKVKTIQDQSKTILELSTPVLRIWDDILVLPLIGAIDTGRATQITDSVLHSIEHTQASVIILDMTGVAIIDTAVAEHLMRTIRSVRLLGAEVIVTGVSSYNALTIVRLGVDMAEIITSGTLQSGLKAAMKMVSKGD